jgi:hypothetical protein
MIANYTTSIPAQKTLGEVMGMLASNGATLVMVENTNDGKPSSLSFKIRNMAFRLPIYPEAMLSALRRDGAPPRYCTIDHASNVAWRVVRDWLRAQIALIDSGMVALDEIMLPYALTPGGQTALERYRDGTLALGPGTQQDEK